jgi:transcriptional regulator with PAS, ATPase and Fis domain
MENLQALKQRFSIIGNDIHLNRALEKALRVAPTDISVLVTGESGVGKESIPKIIHSLSHRKHAKYIAVNCGAIPEGTIDSELFGHEKGSFTGATQDRKGYFEVADGGTIFLDEVGELPLTTQVRLLRVIENGEYIKVGSSKVLKTDVRIIAATNVNMQSAIQKEKFREDLYYRLSTVEIHLPALRERNEDIHLLFRKFASDFAQKYRMPSIRLDENAVTLLMNYRFPGNIRQLKNLAEQISVIEEERIVSAAKLQQYLPNNNGNLPAVIGDKKENDFSTERDIMYKILFDMRNDINDLKELTLDLMKKGNIEEVQEEHHQLIEKIYGEKETQEITTNNNSNIEVLNIPQNSSTEKDYHFIETIEEDESLSLQDKEIEMIKKSLEKNSNKRKLAAKELGISERTLYRKIKQYDL